MYGFQICRSLREHFGFLLIGNIGSSGFSSNLRKLREGACRLILSSGCHGIGGGGLPARQTIQNWAAGADRSEGRRKAKPSPTDPGLTAAERDQLARLRREVRQLKLERDILSRPTVWFARETGVLPSGSSDS